MKKLLVGLAALPFLVGVATAGQPTPLSDAQMDKVTAGFFNPLPLDGIGLTIVFVPISACGPCGAQGVLIPSVQVVSPP